MAALGNHVMNLSKFSVFDFSAAICFKTTVSAVAVFRGAGKILEIRGGIAKSNLFSLIKAMEANGQPEQARQNSTGVLIDDCVGNSSNIVWHKCSVEKLNRQELLNQKGCVIWITGLSGSGKSTLACALSRALHSRGKLTYILDGDNCRHGLNRDLSFTSEDRTENIRRMGEVAKLFADAGVICIASLISPFRNERDACRNLLPKGDFIEVYMDVPLQVCEMRDPKGLYKLARAGKIKGFTGVDDPYEPPLNCEIVLHQGEGICDTPSIQADKVVAYMEIKGYLKA